MDRRGFRGMNPSRNLGRVSLVLLATHVDRGFSLPPHPFFRGFLNFFGAQLHHFTPNTIVYLAAFVSLCENFLGCRPHWGLFKHIFTCRS